MNRRNKLKIVHFFSTGWFIICAVYLSVAAMLQAGRSWWFIASVSWHSAAVVFVLINFYLFSIFRGIGHGSKSLEEHPLSNSPYYIFFYCICPFLGTAAGAIGAIGVNTVNHFLLTTAGGALWATFLVWIIVDPVVGAVEMFLPSSQLHRKRRLAKIKARRKIERLVNEKLLMDLEEGESVKQLQREKTLQPLAIKLSSLLKEVNVFKNNSQTKAVEIGVKAWQMGGIECMKQLHSMTLDQCQNGSEKITDYLSIWWDGVGTWQSSWFDGYPESALSR